MPLTTIRTAPSLDSFTPLAEHQSQTPTTFFGARPVLHFHATAARVLVPKSQVSKLPIFGATDTTAQYANSTDEDESDELEMESADVFVSSESLTIFNSSKSVGISIPYPSIALHAIQPLSDPSNLEQKIRGLYMQLELDPEQDDSYNDEPRSVDVTLLTSPSSTPDASTNSTQVLFEAVSNCSNLNPDLASQEDEEMDDGDDRIVFEGNVGYEGISGLPGAMRGASDGGLPPPFPGSGGWITAENVGEYFDEEGNWIGGEQESLGEGAGRVRDRDEVEGGTEEAVVNGHGTDEEVHKRPRTE